ncbi:MAG: sphingomyelin phosphodiesterase [Paludibacter sp.]|jgi:endonuclease/exonuclease/phosphatase family metal-dependent hydrolase|nr:sphingomyelin phosphodiesterase [Paludibacter sp.]
MYKKLFIAVLFTVSSMFSAFCQAAADAEPNTLKIMSWNIRMLPYINLFNHDGARAYKIAERLKTSDCQIIVFQEAFSNKSRRILKKELAEVFPYQYGPANQTYVPLLTNSGLLVVSKIPLAQLDQICFSQGKGYDHFARKGAVIFQGEYGGTTFQLLATHLQAHDADSIKKKQCEEINTKLLLPYSDIEIPQLLCGDFNIDMYDNDKYELLLNILEARNGELNSDIKYTFDGIENTLAKNTGGKQRLLDYILVRNENPDLKIERKVETFFDKSGTGRSSHLSDHYALEAEIHFSNNKLFSSY